MKPWPLLLLVGCGGAPFTMADPSEPDAAPDSAPAIDAAPDAVSPADDARTELALAFDAGSEASVRDVMPTLDASPDVGRDVTPDTGPDAGKTDAQICTPFGPNIETCPNACSGSCGQPAAAPSVFFRASPSNYVGCAALQTPSACTGCREAFTCACIIQNWTATVAVCGSTTIVATCDDTSGVPVVTCH